MSKFDKSKRKFLVGSGALAMGSMLPGGLLPGNVFAASVEVPVDSWLNATVNSIDEMAGIAPFVSFPTNGKAYLRQQATDFCKIRLEKHLSPVLKKFIGRTTLGAIAPLFMVIFDVIFPGNTPTWDGIKEEIDKRIKAALDKYEYEQKVKQFMALIDAYQMRMETVSKNNNGISDQSKWDLGKPGDWEALINMCLELKNYFYNNNFNRHYEAADLVSDFNFIYFIALNARLQCFEPGDDVSHTVGLMSQLLQGQYNYLKKLAEIAFWDVCTKNSEYGYIRLGPMGMQYGVWNYITNKGSHQPEIQEELSGYDKWDRVTYTHDIIQCRIRFYTLLNTQIINMCQTQFAAVESFNKNFGQNISNAILMIEDFIYINYEKNMNNFQKQTPYNEGGGYYGLTLPGTRDSYGNGRHDFRVNDAYVETYENIYAESNFYSVGDYTTLPESPKGYALEVPRGLRVFLYEETDFKGNMKSYPVRVETSIHSFIDYKPKSMKNSY